MKMLSSEDILKTYQKLNAQRPYRAMYSSLLSGVVTQPEWMMVPVDDHIVHRGDGVFEAIRVTPKKLFLITEHLERLYRSADAVALKIQFKNSEIMQICEDLCRIADLGPQSQSLNEGMLRLFVSRGPGDFSPNPYSTIGSQLYIVATDFKPMPSEKYEKGVSVMISKVATKPAPFSQIKSCNYLPNVLMKKESVDHGFDFSVCVNDERFISEGPTENIMMLNAKNELIAPRFDYTLRGTTLVRVMKLAEKLKFKNIRVDDISIDELMAAKEVMMVGTTLGVLPVTKIENQKIGNQAGPVARELNQMISADMGL